ncbi:hypothetical protein WA026_015953 [Henosepilachna vigintioctopunctata]|uniref:GIY-YIG domain-containing protein n=1 Tax=Henosepilachna vigintioctopunctata TaxID=420089 RepID=A0AAW1U8H8_9CUCU
MPGKYIGQTQQWLKSRVSQHRSDCNIGKNSCALVQHHKKTGHNFDFENVDILDHENRYASRLFLEMLHIKVEEKTAINFKTDAGQLSNIYVNILDRLKLAYIFMLTSRDTS